MILVIAEARSGTLNRATWETLAAVQPLGDQITIVLPGAGPLASLGQELAEAAVAEVVLLESAALELYTPDGYTAALAPVIEELSPSLVALPHTYQTRDLAPKIAARLDRALVTDVTAVKPADEAQAGRVFVRPMFQGKLTADVVLQGPAPHFVTFQIGAFRAEQVVKGTSSAPVRVVSST